MTVLVLKTVKIRSYEMGLYFHDGEFKGLLDAGRHWFFDPLGKVKVEVVSQRAPWLTHEKLDVIVKSDDCSLRLQSPSRLGHVVKRNGAANAAPRRVRFHPALNYAPSALRRWSGLALTC
jgi:hypothetical protein